VSTRQSAQKMTAMRVAMLQAALQPLVLVTTSLARGSLGDRSRPSCRTSDAALWTFADVPRTWR
jgi:hypothetical protein